MGHETSHSTPGFGKNTGGFGIVIVAAVLVLFALVAWGFWNGGSSEDSWYRFEQSAAGHGESHEATEGHDGHDTKAAAPAAVDSTAAGHEAHDSTTATAPAADSAAHH